MSYLRDSSGCVSSVLPPVSRWVVHEGNAAGRSWEPHPSYCVAVLVVASDWALMTFVDVFYSWRLSYDLRLPQLLQSPARVGAVLCAGLDSAFPDEPALSICPPVCDAVYRPVIFLGSTENHLLHQLDVPFCSLA